MKLLVEEMRETLVLVHTVTPLIELFTQTCSKRFPGLHILHILDEPMLEAVRQIGYPGSAAADRLLGHVREAERVGARGVLVTCSTVSPCVDAVRGSARIPVIKIDEEMVVRAVQSGSRIGVIATNPATLGPTRELVEAEASRTHRAVAISPVLVDRAMAALLFGDTATHDQLVISAVDSLLPEVDVIILAQASMARVLGGVEVKEKRDRILTSPELALDQVDRVVFGGWKSR